MHVLQLTIIVLLDTLVACSVWPLFLHIPIYSDLEFRRIDPTSLDVRAAASIVSQTICASSHGKATIY